MRRAACLLSGRLALALLKEEEMTGKHGSAAGSWRTRKLTGPIAIAVAMTLLVAACTGTGEGSSTTGEGEPGTTQAGSGGGTIDELVWSFNTPFATLDPMLAGDLSSESAISNSVEALVVYDSDGVIVPYLAESWTQPDATTYVFKMREGVTFWDGTEMTMDDVLYWLERIMHNDASIFNGYFADVVSFEETADMELTLKLDIPSPTFIQRAVFLFVGQKAYTEEHEDELGTPGALGMYTGQYEMTEWTPGERVILEQYEGYWGDMAPAARIVYRSIEDDETRRLALQSGEIDGAFNVPPGQSEQWAADNVSVVTAPNLQLGYVSFDTASEPWSDIHVRKAVAHAIDREGIVSAIMKGNADVANTSPPPQEWSALLEPDEIESLYTSLPDYEFDLDMARAELALSAFPDGFAAELPVPPTPPELEQIALTISQNLAEVGIDLQVTNVSVEAYRANWFDSKENTGIQLILNGPSAQDPSDFPGQMLTEQYNVSGGYNTANYINPEIEDLWIEQSSSTDPAVRAEAIGEVLMIAGEDAPYAPIIWNRGVAAVSNEFTLDGFHAAWYVIQPWANWISPAGE